MVSPIDVSPRTRPPADTNSPDALSPVPAWNTCRVWAPLVLQDRPKTIRQSAEVCLQFATINSPNSAVRYAGSHEKRILQRHIALVDPRLSIRSVC